MAANSLGELPELRIGFLHGKNLLIDNSTWRHGVAAACQTERAGVALIIVAILLLQSSAYRIDAVLYWCYSNFMSRPPKDPALRMDRDLRIPVTSDQKTLVFAAAAASGMDVAAWVRSLLVSAAKRTLAEKRKHRKRAR